MSKNFVDNDNMTALMTAVGNKLSEKSKIFYGSETDWNNLTVAQKKEYDYWASPEDDGYTTSRIITKLWENPDPTVAFAAQNITLASDGYDFLLFIFLVLAGGRAVSVMVPKEQIGTMNSSYYSVADTSAYTTFVSRTFNVPSGTVVSFGDGYEQKGSSVRTTNNYRCVPYQIYGINMSVTPTSSEIDYSTDEQMIGHWIDGKPIYQQTFLIKAPTVTTPGTMATKSTPHNIANIGSRVKCILHGSGSTQIFGNSNNISYLAAYADATNLNVRTNNTIWSDADVIVTLQYTKTTD